MRSHLHLIHVLAQNTLLVECFLAALTCFFTGLPSVLRLNNSSLPTPLMFVSMLNPVCRYLFIFYVGLALFDIRLLLRVLRLPAGRIPYVYQVLLRIVPADVLLLLFIDGNSRGSLNSNLNDQQLLGNI